MEMSIGRVGLWKVQVRELSKDLLAIILEDQMSEQFYWS